MKRLSVDILLLMATLSLFMLHAYTYFAPPLQLTFLKAMLVSAGLLHAHIARKLLFPRVDWQQETLKGNTYVAIAFYIIIPLCYAFGG
jgi:hypothetical protein